LFSFFSHFWTRITALVLIVFDFDFDFDFINLFVER